VIGMRLVNRQAWERNWTTDMDATVSTPNFSSSADTDRDLGGKTILIVEGSLLSGAELADAFHRAGAHVHLTTNIINAFNLLRREQFDGAVVDQGRHNEVFDLCSELKYLAVPYICSIAPHQTAMRKRDADHAVRQLASKIFAQIETPPALRRQRTRQERWKCLLVDRSDERTAN
jgi:DNA-binding response OmpR family regulator